MSRWILIACIVACGGPLPASEPPLPFDDLFVHVGEVLNDGYYDPGRYRPRLLVERAIRELESTAPLLEVAWSDGRLRINRAGEIDVVSVDAPADLVDAMEVLQELSDRLRRRPYSPWEHRQFEYRMVNGALGTLDPHCALLPPRPASLFKETMRGKFFGIGAFLNQRNGVVRIERVMPGFPAEEAGVQDGDIVLAVDGENISGLSLTEVVRRIKGPEGTTVVLTMERAGEEEPVQISIVRGEVSIITMISHRRGDVGYVRMDEFNRRTARDLDRLLTRMLEAGRPIRALVLDLRYNGGGLLRQAYTISDFFMPAGREIVRTVALGQDPQQYYSGPIYTLDRPMVVMVSPNSASAAEILAGSLQINGRALIVGQSTFGKGSVQTIAALPDRSQLKYTIQEYRLAGGVSIQGQGVRPDLELIRHQQRRDGRLDLVPYTPDRERDNEFSLRGQGVGDARRTDFRLGWLSEYWDEESWKRSRISSKDFRPDQEAALVIDLLVEALDRQGAEERIAAGREDGNLAATTLSLLRGPVAERAGREDEAVAAALAERQEGLVWGSPDRLPPEWLGLAYTGPERVRAGEEVALTFTLANAGDRSGGQYFGVVAADDYSPFLEEEVIFGRVAPRGETTGTLAMRIPLRSFPGRERFTLRLFQGDSREVFAELPVELQVEAVPRPHFSYAWELRRDGEAHGLQLDVPSALHLTVRNDGAGPSLPSLLFVFKDDDPYVQLGKGRIKLPALAPGEETICEVPLTVASEPPPGMIEVAPAPTLKLMIRVTEDFGEDRDSRYAAGLYHELVLPRPVAGTETARPWAGAVRKPLLAVADLRADEGVCRAELSLEDDTPNYVSVFRGEDKIDLVEMSGDPDDPRSVELELADGLNLLRFVATDEDEVSHAISLRLWNAASTTPAVTRKQGAGEPAEPAIP